MTNQTDSTLNMHRVRSFIIGFAPLDKEALAVMSGIEQIG